MCIGFVSELVLPSPKSQRDVVYLTEPLTNSTRKSFFPVVGSSVEKTAVGGVGDTLI